MRVGFVSRVHNNPPECALRVLFCFARQELRPWVKHHHHHHPFTISLTESALVGCTYGPPLTPKPRADTFATNECCTNSRHDYHQTEYSR